MAMMMMAVATGGKVVTNPNQQKLTRRDITDQRIISNILQFNSPTAKKDYMNLRLGPLKATAKTGGFPDYLSKIERDSLNVRSMNNLEKVIDQTQDSTTSVIHRAPPSYTPSPMLHEELPPAAKFQTIAKGVSPRLEEVLSTNVGTTRKHSNSHIQNLSSI